MEDNFLRLKFNILKNYITATMIYHFCLKELELETSKNWQPTCMRTLKSVIRIRNLKQALNHGLVLKKGAVRSLGSLDRLVKLDRFCHIENKTIYIAI